MINGLKKWEDLPEYMRTESVRFYYDILVKKRISLTLKRLFDFVLSLLMLLILFPVMAVISIIIKIDSKGPVFFRQVRVTQYGRKFRIFKFRTMRVNSEAMGSQVTTANDCRVTRVGAVLRNKRLDEIPQLINIFLGDMSYVGTRPEVPRFVKKYSDEMYATLLLPAGVTSEASIRYKDEGVLLGTADDVDAIYVHTILPEKMKYNLESIKKFSFLEELMTMVRTVKILLG